MRKNQFLLDNPVALWKTLVELREDDWTLTRIASLYRPFTYSSHSGTT